MYLLSVCRACRARRWSSAALHCIACTRTRTQTTCFSALHAHAHHSMLIAKHVVCIALHARATCSSHTRAPAATHAAFTVPTLHMPPPVCMPLLRRCCSALHCIACAHSMRIAHTCCVHCTCARSMLTNTITPIKMQAREGRWLSHQELYGARRRQGGFQRAGR